MSTAPDLDDRYRRVRVTHRFHPLFGRDFEFVAYRQNWGEDRVHLHDEAGVLFSLPAGWTDVAAADPFVVMAGVRCPFTAVGLLALAELIGRQRSQREGRRCCKPDYAVSARRITPGTILGHAPPWAGLHAIVAVYLVRQLRAAARAAPRSWTPSSAEKDQLAAEPTEDDVEQAEGHD